MVLNWVWILGFTWQSLPRCQSQSCLPVIGLKYTDTELSNATHIVQEKCHARIAFSSFRHNYVYFIYYLHCFPANWVLGDAIVVIQGQWQHFKSNVWEPILLGISMATILIFLVFLKKMHISSRLLTLGWGEWGEEWSGVWVESGGGRLLLRARGPDSLIQHKERIKT